MFGMHFFLESMIESMTVGYRPTAGPQLMAWEADNTFESKGQKLAGTSKT